MNDDIVIEPGENTTSDEGAATQPSVDTETQTATDTKVPEQVFDVTSDLDIAPISREIEPPIQSQDPKPKNIVPAEISQPLSQPPSQPSYTSTPEAEKTIPGLSPIRTYESDIANLITKKGTSTIDMMMAANRKETGQKDLVSNKEPAHNGKKYLLLTLSLLLIVIGMAGAYYLYSISPLAPATPATPEVAAVSSVIPSDSQKTLPIDGLTSNTILSKIQTQVSNPGIAGTIEEIIPYVTINGVKTRLTIGEMTKIMGITAPDILTRSLNPSWMLGTYTDNQNKKSAFVVVTNNFFQNAFAGMLSWESVMPDDLKQYLHSGTTMGIANVPTSINPLASKSPDPLQNLNSILPLSGTTTNATSSIVSTTTATSSKKTATATTTATTTIQTDIPVIPYFTIRGQFVDKIIKNKDVREFVTVDGKPLFLYSFIDNSKLIIAGNETTLTEIVSRLEKQAFIR